MFGVIGHSGCYKCTFKGDRRTEDIITGDF